jgi:hypothetical protein
MAKVPEGLDAEELNRLIHAHGEEYTRQETFALDRLSTAECRNRWLKANRQQMASKRRLSIASLAYLPFLKALADEKAPPVDEIDGPALVKAGVITAELFTPKAYKQTELMDTIYAIRACWKAAACCPGFDQFVAVLLFRTAVLAGSGAPESILDDSRYARATGIEGLLACNWDFILHTESFFRDVLVQRQWAAEQQSVASRITPEDVASVRIAATNTVFRCKIDYANKNWFPANDEMKLAPGERDSYHRLRPSLKDDGRSVLSLFRAHELTTEERCSIDTLKELSDPRSVLTLCARNWGKELVTITDTGEPVDKPSLRIVCGQLVAVTPTGTFGGEPLDVLSFFLCESNAPIDRSLRPRTLQTIGTVGKLILMD